jgi:hypothetical protein
MISEFIGMQHLPNVGYQPLAFMKSDLQPILEEIEEIQNDKIGAKVHGDKLVGVIGGEYALPKSNKHIDSILRPYVNRYIQESGIFTVFKANVNDHELVIGDCWVNLMGKHEYNPIHSHSGVLSFVIWIDIPYSISDECKNSPKPSGDSTGTFQFVYTDVLGGISTHIMKADKNSNGTGALFPATMRHVVYPFYTSDTKRISVSGNYFFNC